MNTPVIAEHDYVMIKNSTLMRPTTGRLARLSPQPYVTVGISGAIQHLAGMRDAKVIVQINNDGVALIFGGTDDNLETVLFTVMPELVAAQ